MGLYSLVAVKKKQKVHKRCHMLQRVSGRDIKGGASLFATPQLGESASASENEKSLLRIP
jgi:hypothetical protein